MLAISETVDAWLMENPVDCLNHLNSAALLGLLDPGQVDAAFRNFTGNDPEREITVANQLSSSFWQSFLQQKAFGRLSRSNPNKAIEALAHVLVTLRPALVKVLAAELGKTANTEQFTALLQNQEAKSDLLVSTLTEWAKRDPAAALRLIDSLGDEGLRATKQTRMQLLGGLVASCDPKVLVPYLKQQQPGISRDQCLFHAMAALIEQDPLKLQETLTDLPTEAAKTQVLTETVVFLSKKDISAATAMLVSVDSEAARQKLTRTIADALLSRIRAGESWSIEEWLGSLDDPLERAAAVRYFRAQQMNVK